MGADSEVDYVVMGGGLAGLAFATEIATDSVVVLEKDERPGGLLRSFSIDGFWFDAVVHLLYFHDTTIKERFMQFLTADFVSLPQRANVVTEYGETAFPFQFNLGGLPPHEGLNCAVDYIAQLHHQSSEPKDFAAWLLSSFGKRMCEIFFFPYNEKVWKRELTSLASREFVWTIQQATIRNVLSGLVGSHQKESYNSESIYPVPPPGSKLRGMEVLIDLIAAPISRQIKLKEKITRIDPCKQEVTVLTESGEKIYRYRKALVSTLPLPDLLSKVSDSIADPIAFRSNGVVYAMVMLNTELHKTDLLSTYFSDPDIVFTRVIYMQNFDPYSAPVGSGSIMVEVTFRTENGPGDLSELKERIKHDLIATKIVGHSADFRKISLKVHPYGYVVFDHDTNHLVMDATKKLARRNIHLLGRYGKWQYINITQGYEEAMQLAQTLSAQA